MPAQGTCSAPAGGNVQCALGDILAGAATTVTVTMAVPAGFPGGDVVNQATVASPNLDPDATNNQAAFTNSANAAADLSVTKVGDDSVVAGNTITWNVLVHNDGPSNATGVTLSDPLPAGIDPPPSPPPRPPARAPRAPRSRVPSGPSPAAPTCSSRSPRRVLPGGEAGPRPSTRPASTSTTLDPTDSNNSSTSGPTSASRPTLTIQKRSSRSSIVSGGVAVVGITVTNAGPSTAKRGHGPRLLHRGRGRGARCERASSAVRRAIRTAARVHTCPTSRPATAEFVQFSSSAVRRARDVRQHGAVRRRRRRSPTPPTTRRSRP